MKRFRIYILLFCIFVVATAAAFVVLPNGPYLKVGKKVVFKKEIKVREGLDLQGGARVVYEADLSKTTDAQKADAMASLSANIQNRINSFGVAEPVVQTSKVGNSYRLTVEMPGIKDINEATNLIGKTAELEFKELNAAGTDYQTTGLTGKDFQKADVSFDTANQPQIDITFNSAGAKKFEAVTARNVGKPLAIFLDGKLISAPNVSQTISGGRGVISGKFDVKEAKNIAIQLNAGALPVPVKMLSEQSVGATLGRESVTKSLYAGVIGIIFVSLFMLFYYRFLGIFSTIGLAFYLIFMVAIVKLFGITLTMGGIAGLILSVGMSMETDVLVFERIREELRKGRNFNTAVDQGFRNAWPSVRDSNAVSLIIAALLYTAGGTIRGFAVVLIIGIIVGLLTTFIGTKTFLTIAMRFKVFKKYPLYAVKESEVTS